MVDDRQDGPARRDAAVLVDEGIHLLLEKFAVAVPVHHLEGLVVEDAETAGLVHVEVFVVVAVGLPELVAVKLLGIDLALLGALGIELDLDGFEDQVKRPFPGLADVRDHRRGRYPNRRSRLLTARAACPT